ncbi:MAG: hypothetical protein ACM3W8_03720 [Sideroxydans sp.]|nr:hypothetical protein [Sideroxyarcus sp.]
MKQHIISLLAVAVLAVATALPAWADGRHDGRGGGGEHRIVRGWGGERDIRHFETRHYPVWRSGVWRHERHDGRFGWWWVVAGTWYFYPGPIYPYPDPYIPPYVIVQQAPQPTAPAVQPPAQYWYYCEASKNYYPYVSTCAAGWKEVPATPPGAPAQ